MNMECVLTPTPLVYVYTHVHTHTYTHTHTHTADDMFLLQTSPDQCRNLTLYYYSQNDLTLGDFLARFCFK